MAPKRADRRTGDRVGGVGSDGGVGAGAEDEADGAVDGDVALSCEGRSKAPVVSSEMVPDVVTPRRPTANCCTIL